VNKTLAKIALTATTLTVMAHQASAQTVINALPYVISAPGNYLLGKSLVFSPGTATQNAITVNSSNVTIDLNGFYISKPQNGDTSLSFGIYAADRANITVKNGIILGFFEGIRFEWLSRG
jgi:hypothetical protein